MPTPSEEYYTRSVTELADILPVTTSRDVYSTTGLKLVNRGVLLDSTFSEKLCQHSILPPLEQCLVVEHGVDVEQLVEMATNLLHTRPVLMRVARELKDVRPMLDALRAVELSDPMVFLLTLARERRLGLLVHSVTVALISLYLGMRRNLPAQKLAELASAGLFHDLSELRIHEKLLRAGAQPTAEEREQIYMHPASSQRILLNAGIYPLDIVNAVMRHHECLDGSGYPFGLVGSEMGELAKILSIAELAVSKLDQQERDGKPCLEIALKYNLQKYDAELLSQLGFMYEHEEGRSADVRTLDLVDPEMLRLQISYIFLVMEFWKRLKGAEPVRLRSPSAYIEQRLQSLAQATREAGINISNASSVIDGMQGDEQCLQDLFQINQETLAQIREVVFEVQRRWPKYYTDQTPIGKAVNGWMEYMQELLLHKKERVRI